MIKFYVIFSVVCAVAIFNCLNIVNKRAVKEFELEEKFNLFKLIFSSQGLKVILLSFIPILNMLLLIVVLFFENRVYDNVAEAVRKRLEK